MKITKTQLKKIIKEELENIQEDPSPMSDMESAKLIFDAIVQMGINFSPVILASLIFMLMEQYRVSLGDLVSALRAKFTGSGREEKE